MKLNLSSPLVLIGVVICVLCLTVGAIAAYNYLTTVDGHAKILTPATVTASPAFLEWGDVTVGEVYARSVFLTNNGQTATTMLDFVYTLPADTTMTSSSSTPIAAGGTNEVVFTFTIGETALAGDYTVKIEVNHGEP